jgi:adenylosuccinate lyase
VIRRHSVAAANAVKNGAPRNDMLDRLAADPEFTLPLDDLRSVMDAHRFIGRASEQVTDFLNEVVAPLLEHAPGNSVTDEALRV